MRTTVAAYVATMALTFTGPMRAPAAAQQNVDSVYMFGLNGQFIKLRMSDRTMMALWNLARLDGLSTVLPVAVPERAQRADGVWQVSGVRVDRARRRLYLIAPASPSVGSQRLIALRLPDLSLIASREVPVGSSLLITQPGGELLLSYVTQENERFSGVTERVRSTDLQTTTKSVASLDRSAYLSGAQLDGVFGWSAHIAPDQATIVDGLKKITVKGDAWSTRTVDVPQLLAKTGQEARIALLRKKDASSGKEYLPLSVADSQSGKTLVRVPGSSMAIVVDVIEEQVIAMFALSNGRSWLTPDGKYVVVEEETLRSKSGVIRISNAATGGVVREIGGRELSGDTESHSILCMSEDGTGLFYRANERMFWVSLTETRVVAEVRSGFEAGRWVACAFAGV